MLYNKDGTKKALETAIEELDTRFRNSEFPQLSDILGSDWASELATTTPYLYKSKAYYLAEVHYLSMYD